MRGALPLLCALVLAGSATADITRPLPMDSDDVSEIATRHATFTSERYLVVNGQVIRAELGRTDLGPREYIDRVQRDWEARYGQSLDLGPLAETEALFEAQSEQMLRRPFRRDGPGWSTYGKLFGGRIDGGKPFLASLIETGALGEGAAGGAMVSAYEDGDGGSDVWLMHLDEDFKPSEYLGLKDSDRGPGDIPEIQRYPGTRRGLTVSEYSEMAETHSLTYVGPGSIESHADHYEQQLQPLGMMQAPTTRRRGEILLRFADQKRDVGCLRSPHPDALVIGAVDAGAIDARLKEKLSAPTQLRWKK